MKNKNGSIAIVSSQFNKKVTDSLLKCCLDELRRQGIKKSTIQVFKVPGAYEIPFTVNELAQSKKPKAIITLGCIIKGETSHDVHIASWVSHSLGQISLKHRVPVLFGVLTPNSEAQALKRSRPGPLNRGKEVAKAAVDTIKLTKRIQNGT